jgi:hypothetical protein
LFRDQGKRWRSLVKANVQAVLDGAMSMLYSAIDFVTDEYTSKTICQQQIDAFMKRRRKTVFGKLDEILKPFEKFHVITYDKTFLEASQVIRRQGNAAEWHQQSLQTFNSVYPKENSKEATMAIVTFVKVLTRLCCIFSKVLLNIPLPLRRSLILC